MLVAADPAQRLHSRIHVAKLDQEVQVAKGTLRRVRVPTRHGRPFDHCEPYVGIIKGRSNRSQCRIGASGLGERLDVQLFEALRGWLRQCLQPNCLARLQDQSVIARGSGYCEGGASRQRPARSSGRNVDQEACQRATSVAWKFRGRRRMGHQYVTVADSCVSTTGCAAFDVPGCSHNMTHPFGCAMVAFTVWAVVMLLVEATVPVAPEMLVRPLI